MSDITSHAWKLVDNGWKRNQNMHIPSHNVQKMARELEGAAKAMLFSEGIPFPTFPSCGALHLWTKWFKRTCKFCMSNRRRQGWAWLLVMSLPKPQIPAKVPGNAARTATCLSSFGNFLWLAKWLWWMMGPHTRLIVIVDLHQNVAATFSKLVNQRRIFRFLYRDPSIPPESIFDVPTENSTCNKSRDMY